MTGQQGPPSPRSNLPLDQYLRSPENREWSSRTCFFRVHFSQHINPTNSTVNSQARKFCTNHKPIHAFANKSRSHTTRALRRLTWRWRTRTWSRHDKKKASTKQKNPRGHNWDLHKKHPCVTIQPPKKNTKRHQLRSIDMCASARNISCVASTWVQVQVTTINCVASRCVQVQRTLTSHPPHPPTHTPCKPYSPCVALRVQETSVA